MNPPFSDKILLLLASKSMTRSRSMSITPSMSLSPSPSPSTVTVQGSQGSNLLLVVAVPISVFAAILLAIIVIQAIYYNRQRIRVHQLTEVPLPAISMSPILRPQAQVFDANDPCNLEDPPFTTENPMHKNVAI
jgi:hypothetical protein